MKMSQLKIKEIRKVFGKKEVLKEVSFTLETGHIYGLLGRNGVGKSTLLSIINNQVVPTSGDILLDGESILESDRGLRQLFLVNDSCLAGKENNKKIQHYLNEACNFYPEFDLERAEHLLGAFDLKKTTRLHKLSTGYRSIVNIVLALSMKVPFIFLDEPILGLDANHRDLFYKELLEVFGEGQTSFILSTHLIEEVSHIIDGVIILSDGQVVVEETVDAVLEQGWAVTGPEMAIIDVKSKLASLGWERLGNEVTLYIYGEKPDVSADLVVSKPDLQKLFIQLTGREVR